MVSKFLNGDVRILCCTDIASRGWDTINVNHVINYEMPQFIADYLHRIGRVGRLNKGVRCDGKVTSLVTKRHEVDLIWNIEKSVRLNCELDNVNANVKRFYKNMYAGEFEEHPSSSNFSLKNKNAFNLHKSDSRRNYKYEEEEDEDEEEYAQNEEKIKTN